MKFIGIAGGSGTGKTSIANMIKTQLANRVTIIPLDSYYNDNSHLLNKEREMLNFDHPSAFDFDLLYEHLCLLQQGIPVEQPTYSYIKRTRKKESITVNATEIFILEGILPFYDNRISKFLDIKFFIDLDENNRLNNIIKRDVEERGRNKEEVIDRFHKEVNPMHIKYIDSQKQKSDFILNELDLEIASKTIINHIKF